MNEEVLTVFLISIITSLLLLHLTYQDRCLTHAQISERGWLDRGEEAWSLMEDGGLWIGIIVFTFVSAYIVGKYEFKYISVASMQFLIAALVVSLRTLWHHAYAGEVVREPLTRDGRPTTAGCVWTVFTTLALWIIATWYFTEVTPTPKITEVMIISIILTLYVWASDVKFSKRWDPTSSWIPSLIYTVVILGMTIYRCLPSE